MSNPELSDLNARQSLKGGWLTRCCLILAFSFTCASRLAAQSGGFELQTSPNVDFIFNTFEKYENGIVIPHALELNINASGAQWDLYMGVTTTAAGSWNELSTYSTTGISPVPVNLLQARVYSQGNTQTMGGTFFPVTDVAAPVYIIGSTLDDPGISCGGGPGTNEAGDYLTAPSCYKFNVDFKIDPGFSYRPGLYTLRVDFYIIEDL